MKLGFPYAASALLLSVAFASCIFSTSRNSGASALQGTWQLDSVAVRNDSSMYGLFLAMALGKDPQVRFRFRGDTLFTGSATAGDTTLFEVDERQAQIKFREPDTTHLFQYNRPNDSVFYLTSGDSTTLFLRRLHTSD